MLSGAGGYNNLLLMLTYIKEHFCYHNYGAKYVK